MLGYWKGKERMGYLSLDIDREMHKLCESADSAEGFTVHLNLKDFNVLQNLGNEFSAINYGRGFMLKFVGSPDIKEHNYQIGDRKGNMRYCSHKHRTKVN